MIVDVAPAARDRFDQTLLLYSSYMSDRSLDRIQLRIDKMLVYLTKNPRFGPYADGVAPGKDGVRYRKVTVGKIKIIYKIVGDRIKVSDIFDARQDPRKMRG